MVNQHVIEPVVFRKQVDKSTQFVSDSTKSAKQHYVLSAISASNALNLFFATHNSSRVTSHVVYELCHGRFAETVNVFTNVFVTREAHGDPVGSGLTVIVSIDYEYTSLVFWHISGRWFLANTPRNVAPLEYLLDTLKIFESLLLICSAFMFTTTCCSRR